MEVNLLDKLLYRPVVNTVYMKPNRRLGRIIGINGNQHNESAFFVKIS